MYINIDIDIYKNTSVKSLTFAFSPMCFFKTLLLTRKVAL